MPSGVVPEGVLLSSGAEFWLLSFNSLRWYLQQLPLVSPKPDKVTNWGLGEGRGAWDVTCVGTVPTECVAPSPGGRHSTSLSRATCQFPQWWPWAPQVSPRFSGKKPSSGTSLQGPARGGPEWPTPVVLQSVPPPFSPQVCSHHFLPRPSTFSLGMSCFSKDQWTLGVQE